MFTGIIKNRAAVTARKAQGGQVRFCFRFLQSEKRKLELGESIAVDGVCLTVAKIVPKGFEADAVRETLQATTLSGLQKGNEVNIERALRYGDLLGGHFVSGHVDGRGEILKIEIKGRNRLYFFKTPKTLAPFIAPKGSVVIDGISLTVQSVSRRYFTVTIVPHTWTQTSLRCKKQGDEVNLEADLVARYLKRMESFLRQPRKTGKTRLRPMGSGEVPACPAGRRPTQKDQRRHLAEAETKKTLSKKSRSFLRRRINDFSRTLPKGSKYKATVGSLKNMGF